MDTSSIKNDSAEGRTSDTAVVGGVGVNDSSHVAGPHRSSSLNNRDGTRVTSRASAILHVSSVKIVVLQVGTQQLPKTTKQAASPPDLENKQIN